MEESNLRSRNWISACFDQIHQSFHRNIVRTANRSAKYSYVYTGPHLKKICLVLYYYSVFLWDNDSIHSRNDSEEASCESFVAVVDFFPGNHEPQRKKNKNREKQGERFLETTGSL